MTLIDLCGEYQTIRPLSPQAAYLMRRTAVLFGQHLGRAATVEDLQDLLVSRWLASQQGSAWTLAGHRTRILSLWRFASRHGYCGPPGEVRRSLAVPAFRGSTFCASMNGDIHGGQLAGCDQLRDVARGVVQDFGRGGDAKQGHRRGPLAAVPRRRTPA